MFPPDELTVTIQEPKLQKLNHPLLNDHGVCVDVLRYDKIHPVVSGNKFFKLRYFLQQAQQEEKGICTFGGPWSNHLHATAAACQLLNIPCIGIVRGERPVTLSATLLDCEASRMRLIFTERTSYQQGIVPEDILQDYLIVPEGGAAPAGVRGAATMLDYIDLNRYDELVCAVGTGTMMAGFLTQQQVFVRGFCVLKMSGVPATTVDQWILEQSLSNNFTIEYDYHFGGYARHPEALLKFMENFTNITAVPVDFVYCARMFYGLLDMVRSGKIPSGARICAIHSGGLQGNRSLHPVLYTG